MVKNDQAQKRMTAILGYRNSTQREGRAECDTGRGWSNMTRDQAPNTIGTKDFESSLCQEAGLYLVGSGKIMGNDMIKCMLKNKNRSCRVVNDLERRN